MPAGTEPFTVLLEIAAKLPRLVLTLRRGPLPAAGPSEAPPRGPRGEQLWLRYDGAECDEHGWRLMKF